MTDLPSKDQCPYGQVGCPGGALCTCALPTSKQKLLRDAADDCEAEANNLLNQAPNMGPTKERSYRAEAEECNARAKALRAWADSFPVETTGQQVSDADLEEIANAYDQGPNGTFEYDSSNILKMLREVFVLGCKTRCLSEEPAASANTAICKTCGQTFELHDGHKCPGLSVKAGCALCAEGMNSFADPATGNRMHARNGLVTVCTAQNGKGNHE